MTGIDEVVQLVLPMKGREYGYEGFPILQELSGLGAGAPTEYTANRIDDGLIVDRGNPAVVR